MKENSGPGEKQDELFDWVEEVEEVHSSGIALLRSPS